MDSSHTSISKSRACPTARTAVTTWTRCDGRLLPRRANEGYTAELAAFARLVCQAYHRRPARTAVRAPCASTRSLQMPAEQEVVSHVTECCPDKPRNVLAFRMSQGAVRALGMASRREPCMTALSCRKSGWIIAGAVEPHGIDVGWEADEVPCRSFSDFLPPNWTCAFQRIQLSSIAVSPCIHGLHVHQLDVLSSHRMSILDVHVTRSTENQGLAFPCCHHFHPSGFVAACVLFQVFERPDVVNLDFVCERCCSALLTNLGEEALFQFGSLSPYPRRLVLKGCFRVPSEWNTTPGGSERFLALSLNYHLKALVLDPIHVQFGSVLLVHLRHRQFVFVRQRLCQRGVHDPFQVLEGVQVVGHPVVIDDTAIFQLVGRGDRVFTLFGQFAAMDRFSFALVAIAFFLENCMGYTQSNLSIDASAHRSFVATALGVVLDGGDFVPQEFCGLRSGVGDERLCFREFQLQFVTQKRGELLLDLFCLCLWTNKTQKKVVSIPTIPESSVLWVLRVERRQVASPLFQCLCFLDLPFLEQIGGTVSEFFVLHIPFLLIASGVTWDQDGFDIFVQLVEQDIRKNWAGNRSLWNSTQGSVEFPILEVSSVKELLDEVDETSIMDVFC